MTAPVSLIVLTHNEEANIADCIDSLSVLSDDIHVLDSYSIDSTLEIAKTKSVHTYLNRFTGFGDQRNWAIDNISTLYDWQLHLDADERVTPEFILELKEILNTSPPHAGFLVANKLILNGTWIKYASGYPVYQVRLFHKNRLRFENYGHGQREVTMGTLGRMKTPYLHYGFSNGIRSWFVKHVTYADKEAEEALSCDKTFLQNLGKLFVATRSERRRLLKALSHNLPARPSLRYWSTLLIKGAILDGKEGWTYAKMMATYEAMTDILKDEKSKTRQNRNPR